MQLSFFYCMRHYTYLDSYQICYLLEYVEMTLDDALFCDLPFLYRCLFHISYLFHVLPDTDNI
jgi:hypothetical protein